jgi:AcrR family transcriptional regulator
MPWVMPKPARAAPPAKRGSLRSRLHDATRRVILDAMVEQLADTGAFDFSMFELARRANVSARTIYRHFPTRDALFDALAARVNEELGTHEPPRTLDAASELARSQFTSFDAHAELVTAELVTRQSFRSPARPARLHALQKAVAEAAPNTSESTRRQVAGVIACLLAPDTWARLHHDLRLDGRDAGEAVAFVIDAIKRKLEADQRKAKQR